jgi:hypothetical protein
MFNPKSFLIAGGIISALISLLHVILALKPGLYSYIGPAKEIQMSATTASIASVVLALIFAAWAAYAFSGAGLIEALPLLRPALIAIGAIYVLRSLFIFTEVRMVLNEGYPFRFVIFSIISLVTGLLYLIGILKK